MTEATDPHGMTVRRPTMEEIATTLTRTQDALATVERNIVALRDSSAGTLRDDMDQLHARLDEVCGQLTRALAAPRAPRQSDIAADLEAQNKTLAWQGWARHLASLAASPIVMALTFALLNALLARIGAPPVVVPVLPVTP